MKLSKYRIIAMVLLVAMICSIMTGCNSKKPMPEDTIKKFEDAVNSYDVDKIFDCIESETAEQIQTLLSIAANNKIDTERVFAILKILIPALPVLTDGAIQKGDLPKIELTVLNSNVEDTQATVELSGIISCGELNHTFNATVDMQLENEEWVICGIS